MKEDVFFTDVESSTGAGAKLDVLGRTTMIINTQGKNWNHK